MTITAYSKRKGRISLQPGHKVLAMPKDRAGWSQGEWAGFYEGLRAQRYGVSPAMQTIEEVKEDNNKRFDEIWALQMKGVG